MKCPYCENEMVNGALKGDGRTKVRWHNDGKKIGNWEKITSGKGMIEAKYTITTFAIKGYYCDKCEKIIIDSKVKNFNCE